MKAKSGSKNPPKNGKSSSNNTNMRNGDDGNDFGNSPEKREKEKKPINKKNPWNIDPFMPNFTKPSINLITQNEEANKSETQTRSNQTPPLSHRVSPQTSKGKFILYVRGVET